MEFLQLWLLTKLILHVLLLEFSILKQNGKFETETCSAVLILLVPTKVASSIFWNEFFRAFCCSFARNFDGMRTFGGFGSNLEKCIWQINGKYVTVLFLHCRIYKPLPYIFKTLFWRYSSNSCYLKLCCYGAGTEYN